MSSLRIRILLGTSAILFAFLFLLGSYVVNSQKEQLIKNLEDHGQRIASLTARSCSEYIQRFSFFLMEDQAMSVEQSPEVAFCEIYDSNGKSLLQSGNIVSADHNKKNSPEDAANLLLVSQPIMAGDTLLGRVDIGLKLDSIDKAIRQKAIHLVYLFVGFALCIVGVLSLFFQQIFIKPIQNLTRCTQSVAQGDFASFDTGGRNDEIGVLAYNFNAMSQSLKGLYGGLESKVKEHTVELEKANLELKQLVEHAESMAKKAEEGTLAKSQFLAAMSHEIRTPMNSVLGMAEALSETSLTGDQKSYIKVLKEAGNTLLGLIDDILDLSKIESGDVIVESIPFQLEDVLAQVFSLASYVGHNKGLDLDYMMSPATPKTLIGDPHRLQQVLMNLVSNGVKFTHKGYVHVEVDVLSGNDGNQTQEVTLQFVVRDSGIGIVPDALDTIFDKFTQADSSTTRNYGGSGLGLSICKSLCEVLGGQIDIESAHGVGTSVIFNLPFGVAPETLAERSPLAGKHILLIDDRDRLEERLAARIESVGGAVDIEQDFISAVGALRSEQSEPLYDAVIMNTPLQGMSWRTVAAELVSIGLDSQRIILLTTDEMEDARDFYAVGGVIGKPASLDKVQAAVERISATPQKAEKMAGKGLSILLVEDNEANVMLIEVYLKGTDHSLHVANDGQEGFERYRSGSYDIVFMDIEMPVLDGFGCTKLIRDWERENNWLPAPIIALTAHALNEIREKALAAGCNSHLTKPISKQDFLKAIDDSALTQFL